MEQKISAVFRKGKTSLKSSLATIAGKNVVGKGEGVDTLYRIEVDKARMPEPSSDQDHHDDFNRYIISALSSCYTFSDTISNKVAFLASG